MYQKENQADSPICMGASLKLPLSAAGADCSYLKGLSDCGPLSSYWLHDYSKTHCYTKQREIRTHSSMQFFSIFFLDYHRIITVSWAGRDPHIKTASLLTRYVGTTAEKQKEIISLEIEFYYPNCSKTLYLNKWYRMKLIIPSANESSSPDDTGYYLNYCDQLLRTKGRILCEKQP